MTTFALSRVPRPMVLRPLTAAELMQPRSLTFDETTSISKASALLRHYQLDAAPVVNEHEQPVGWVTLESCAAWDDFSRRSSMRGVPVGRSTADQSDWVPVTEIASPNIESVPSDATSAEVARALLESRSGRVFVVDDEGRLEGIITQFDILRRLGEADGPAMRISRSGASQLC